MGIANQRGLGVYLRGIKSAHPPSLSHFYFSLSQNSLQQCPWLLIEADCEYVMSESSQEGQGKHHGGRNLE